MKTLTSKTNQVVWLALFSMAGAVQAADISGTISSTMTITGDNRLTGNVNCTVTSGPCIKFGADNTQLHLNGFVMTGNNASLTTCTATTNVSAIDTGKFNNAKIEGPGIITLFTGNGIVLTGSNSEVHQVVITFVCFNGIAIAGGGNDDVHENSISRYALIPTGANGVAVGGTAGDNQIHQNAISNGNGYAIIVVSSDNTIQQNNVSGNGLGILIYPGSLANVIDSNQALGSFPQPDIYDFNPAGNTNKYHQNLCQRAGGPGVPPSLCPGEIPAGLIGNH